MNQFRFSAEADADLADIYAYTAQRWSEEQAKGYTERSEDACERLARMPGIGRLCDRRRAGLRRWEEASHVIFYEQVAQELWSAAFCTGS